MIIYGIKTCGSVRKAIKFCKDNNLEYIFHDFRQNPLEPTKIDFFISHIDINLLFNNKGTKYRDLKLKDLNLDDEGKLTWLKKENMLLKRPIIEYNNQALCAFDEELYKTTFL
jgi:Spx/MgsR family transcriptional regulator